MTRRKKINYLLVGILGVVAVVYYFGSIDHFRDEVSHLGKLKKVEVYSGDGVAELLIPEQPATLTVIQFLDTECPLCLDHLKPMMNDVSKYPSVRFIFASPEPMNRVKTFFIKQGLVMSSNARLVKTPLQTILDTFGDIAPPTAYVYDSRGDLVR